VLNQEIIGSMTLDRVDFPSADIQSYAVPPNLLLKPVGFSQFEMKSDIH
jgi:hypothetical protein